MAESVMASATGFDPATPVDPSRVHAVTVAVGVVLAMLSAGGSFLSGTSAAISYVGSLGAAALVVLGVSMVSRRHIRPWRWVGLGLTIWAGAGFLTTIKYEANYTQIPDLLIFLGYSLGYVPVLLGLAELADPQMRVRRLGGLLDGLLLLLVLYAVLWLLIVAQYSVDEGLPTMDRAFGALYPAGDLAMVMLSARIVVSHVARRRVGLMLLAGSFLSLTADVLLLALYLWNPDGSYPYTDALYLGGLSLIGLAAIGSLLPAPPPVSTTSRLSQWMLVIVAGSLAVPPVVLLGVVALTDRQISPVPIALWMVIAVGLMVARHLSGVRELERMHQQALWLASHDVPTGTMLRAAFFHEMAEGGLRDRSGTVFVVELQGVREIADEHGLEVADQVIAAIVGRLRHATGVDAVIARLGYERFAAFMRASDSALGRQVGNQLQRVLPEPVTLPHGAVTPVVCTGVAQADGAVIDVLAGVRRATAAMQYGRLGRTSTVVFDADLTGRADLGLEHADMLTRAGPPTGMPAFG